MILAEMLTPEISLAGSRLRASSRVPYLLGLLATVAACNGSIDAQDTVSSRPKTDTPSNGPRAPGPTTGAANAAGARANGSWPSSLTVPLVGGSSAPRM